MTLGMSTLVGSVAAYVVVGVLLVACAGHLVRPAALPAALAAHGFLPVPVGVAALLTGAEGLLGVAGAVALLRGHGGGLLVVALAGAASLLVLVGAYGWYVVSTGRGGPCGCSRLELPMTGWVVARALALAALALVALALSDSVLPLVRPGTGLAIVLLAAASFAFLLWQLPAAMHDPAPAGALRMVGPAGRR